MNITPVLKLATAFVAFSISAHAAEIFSVSAIEDDWPTAKDSADFNALDENGVPTNQYNIYGTIDSGIGSGWGSGTTYNFDGVTAVNPGDQSTAGSNTTTYLGPKFYAGINRDVQQLQAGVIHSYGNGYRIRCNNITAEIIANNGGVSPSAEAVFMFDVKITSESSNSTNFTLHCSITFFNFLSPFSIAILNFCSHCFLYKPIKGIFLPFDSINTISSSSFDFNSFSTILSLIKGILDVLKPLLAK